MDRISKLFGAIGVVAVIAGSLLGIGTPAAPTTGQGDDHGSVRITDGVVIHNRDM
jgi:hypothetical protein